MTFYIFYILNVLASMHKSKETEQPVTKFDMIHLCTLELGPSEYYTKLSQYAHYFSIDDTPNHSFSLNDNNTVMNLIRYVNQVYIIIKSGSRCFDNQKEKQVAKNFLEKIKEFYPEYYLPIEEFLFQGVEKPVLIRKIFNLGFKLRFEYCTAFIGKLTEELKNKIKFVFCRISKLLEIREKMSLIYLNLMYQDKVFKINNEFSIQEVFDFFCTKNVSIFFIIDLCNGLFTNIELKFNAFKERGNKLIEEMKQNEKHYEKIISCLIEYEWMKDLKFESFLAENRIYNDLKNSYCKHKYLSVASDINNYINENKLFYEGLWNILNDDIGIQEDFDKIYERELSGLKRSLDNYRVDFATKTFKSFYSITQESSFMETEPSDIQYVKLFYKENFEKKKYIFFDNYAYFYAIINISSKLPLKRKTIEKISKDLEDINKILMLMGVIEENKQRIKFNFFNCLDIWAEQMHYRPCHSLNKFEKVIKKFDEKNYIQNTNLLGFNY